MKDLLIQSAGEASAAATDPLRWHSFTRTVARYVDSTVATLFIPAPPPIGGVISGMGYTDSDYETYFDKWIDRDPWNIAGKGRGLFQKSGAILTGRDYISDREFLRTDYYQQHGRFVGSGHKLFLKVCGPGDPLVPEIHLTLGRPFECREFCAEERMALSRLWPHLHAAAQTWARLRNVDFTRRIGEPSLAMLPLPCWVMRENGLVDFANHRAELSMRQQAPRVQISAGKLVRASSADQTKILTLLKQAAFGLATHADLVFVAADGHPHRGRLDCAPLRESPIYAAAWPLSCALLTLSAAMDADKRDWIDLIDNITPKQREVLRLLARGDRLVEIADKLEIRHSTVKVHIKNLCAATGCRSQADLVRIAITGQPPRSTK